MSSKNPRSLRVAAALVLALAALALPGCETGDGTTVGPRGGTVTSQDGRVTLYVPAGALTDDVELTIVEATELPQDAIGPAYAIEPYGLVFGRPAALVYEVGEEMNVDPEAVRLVVERGEQWNALADRDVDMASLQVSASVLYSSVVGIVE